MSEPENLVLELLRAIRADIADIRRVQHEHTRRLSRIEEAGARARRDQASDAETVAHVEARMDRLAEDVERIKRRLDIAD